MSVAAPYTVASWVVGKWVWLATSRHVLMAQKSWKIADTIMKTPHPPALSHLTPTTRDVEVTLVYGAAHTGHVGRVAVASICARHSSWTYRSVQRHADLRGTGVLSVQMKHSGASSSSRIAGDVPSLRGPTAKCANRPA